MNHVVSYFGPNEFLSKQKHYLRYKMTKPRKLTTRQYVGLVRDPNSRMAHLPPLFDESQVLEESELVDFLANKAPKSHKAMLINQGFNPETSTLETFVEHCERAETTDDISGANFAASDKESNPRRKKRKTKSDRGKKRIKRSTKMYCSLHGENTSHNSKDWKTLKAKGKAKPKFSKKDFNKKARELNLIEKEAFLEKAKYLKYKSLNKASKKKTTVILELSESESSSSKEEDSSSE